MQYRNSTIWIMFLLIISFSCGKGKDDPTPDPIGPPAGKFRNPLLTSGPDPWVVQKDSFYYYTHTSGNRITIWRTKKMSELPTAALHTIWTAPLTGPNSKNVWAPELHFINNKWYAYYTAGASNDLATQRMYVLENSNADPFTGIWTEKGQVRDPAADFFAIDASVLSHNGNHYLIWSGQSTPTDATQRIYIARMSDPWTLSTARVQISAPEYNWEMNGDPDVNEGPEILKNNAGKIFLVYSASGCWTDDYALGLLTLQDGGDPLNPAHWTKTPSPVFSKNTTNAVYGPGHNAFFKSVDGTEDWIIYHANSTAAQGCTDNRSPRMQKFTWNSNGTPNFGTPVASGEYIQKPSGE